MYKKLFHEIGQKHRAMKILYDYISLLCFAQANIWTNQKPPSHELICHPNLNSPLDEILSWQWERWLGRIILCHLVWAGWWIHCPSDSLVRCKHLILLYLSSFHPIVITSPVRLLPAFTWRTTILFLPRDLKPPPLEHFWLEYFYAF